MSDHVERHPGFVVPTTPPNPAKAGRVLLGAPQRLPFATAAGKSREPAARYADAPDTGDPALWFTLTNTPASAVTFTVTSGQYRGDGPWTYTVPLPSQPAKTVSC
ncbi:phospholipase domain-containing protein [Streptomyces sp. NPDC127117]|uniref:phospholipase domain-containing protein n=1 Tax=Streptomyces sp. NPDC127117 TaxID=3345368 RepID=UPI00363341D7